jgi:hypothetical protein
LVQIIIIYGLEGILQVHEKFIPMAILLSSYVIIGVLIYKITRKIFKTISGESRSKILIISFFILLGYHVFAMLSENTSLH